MVEATIVAFILLILFDDIVELFRGRTKMPVAVVTSQPERFELKSLPEGYVVIREMTYGERIMRGGLTGAMKILKDNKSDYAGEMSMETQKITLWDFANLVVDHNCEAYNDPSNPAAGTRTLDFKKEADVRLLASKVGDEIGTYIDKINNFEDVEAGN